MVAHLDAKILLKTHRDLLASLIIEARVDGGSATGK